LARTRGKIKDLEDEVFKQERRELSYDSVFFPSLFRDRTLREMVEDNNKSIDKINSKLQAILDHLGQEYVEITEKNGDTKIFNKLRKKKKITQ